MHGIHMALRMAYLEGRDTRIDEYAYLHTTFCKNAGCVNMWCLTGQDVGMQTPLPVSVHTVYIRSTLQTEVQGTTPVLLGGR